MKSPLDWVPGKAVKVADTPQPHGTWKYHMILPRFLAEWDIMAAWEKVRTLDMAEHLNKGDVLFDIGTEYGWQSAMYAQMVGPENMVLIEPSPVYWPCIRGIWEHNDYPSPKAAIRALFSNKTTVSGFDCSTWPVESEAEVTKLLSYQYIHEHGHVTPQITIDDFVEATGIIPDAITMDTEGSETVILEGAVNTLRKYKPTVWVSVHPCMSLTNYGKTDEDLYQLMGGLKYSRIYLGKDHEEHVRFS